jgi:hypothetical protein
MKLWKLKNTNLKRWKLKYGISNLKKLEVEKYGN